MTEEILFYGRALLGAFCAGGIAWLIGRRSLHLAGLTFDSAWEDLSSSAAAGLAILSLALFALGVAHVLTKLTTAVVIAGLILASLPALPRRRAHTPASGLRVLTLVITAFLALPLLALPLYPPTGPDAITYHLAVAKTFASSGTVAPTPEFRYAVFPELVEMLFTGALLLGSEITAQTISLVALLVSACAITGFLRRTSGEQSGLWGAGLFLSSSAILLLAGTAYGDMTLTAFVTVSLFAFERWRSGGGSAWLAFSGAMAGCAAGTKYSALFFPPAILLLLVLGARDRPKLTAVLLFSIACALAASPWYAYNTYHTGNPVWPFFGSVFGLKYWNSADIAGQSADLLTQYGSGKSLRALLMLPWNLFAHAEMFHTEGTLSWPLLAALPFGLYGAICRRDARRIALVAGAYALFWFFTSQIMRYLIPVIPLACAVCGAGAAELFRRHLSPRMAAAGGAALGVALFVPAFLFPLRQAGLDGLPPTSPGARNRFLEKRLPSYAAIEFLNSRARGDWTLYSYHDPQMAYFTRGRFRGDFFGPWRYASIEAALPAAEDSLREALVRLGVNYLLVRDDSAGSGCGPGWLTRRHVVPIYRAPEVALFRVSRTPLAASFSPELTSGPPEELQRSGCAFSVREGEMYSCTCTASAEGLPATATLGITWLDGRGRQMRTDEVQGVFLPVGTTLELLASAPHGAPDAILTLEVLGGATVRVVRLSARAVNFLPPHR